MAKATFAGSVPVDTPAMRAPAEGFVHAEAEFFGNASPERGIYARFGRTPAALAKGSRWGSMVGTGKALTGPGPFKNMR